MRAASILQSSKAREAEKAVWDKGGRETRPADVPRPWEPVEPSHHHPFASLSPAARRFSLHKCDQFCSGPGELPLALRTPAARKQMQQRHPR